MLSRKDEIERARSMGLELNAEGNAWVPISPTTRRMIRPTNHSRQRPPPQPMSPTHQDMVVRLPSANSEPVPNNPTTGTLQIVLIVAYIAAVVSLMLLGYAIIVFLLPILGSFTL